MGTFGSVVKSLRKNKKLTQTEFAVELSRVSGERITRSAVGMWESNQRRPKFEVLEAIADYFNVDMDYLLGRTNYNFTIKDKSGKILSKEKSPPAGFKPMPPMDIIPLVGDIACGSPILAEENIRDYIAAPSSWRADFVLECHGDSMAPKILDGDIVAIRKVAIVENGRIAAVRIDDEATLKRMYRYQDKLILQAENPAYEPIVLIGEDMERVAIEGLAVGLMRHV